jgi:hypothetical protein
MDPFIENIFLSAYNLWYKLRRPSLVANRASINENNSNSNHSLYWAEEFSQFLPHYLRFFHNFTNLTNTINDIYNKANLKVQSLPNSTAAALSHTNLHDQAFSSSVKKLLNLIHPHCSIHPDATAFINDLLIVLLDYISCCASLINLTDSISDNSIEDTLALIFCTPNQEQILKVLSRKIEKAKSKYKYRQAEYYEKFCSKMKEQLKSYCMDNNDDLGLNSCSIHCGTVLGVNLVDRLLSSSHQRHIVYNIDELIALTTVLEEIAIMIVNSAHESAMKRNSSSVGIISTDIARSVENTGELAQLFLKAFQHAKLHECVEIKNSVVKEKQSCTKNHTHKHIRTTQIQCITTTTTVTTQTTIKTTHFKATSNLLTQLLYKENNWEKLYQATLPLANQQRQKIQAQQQNNANNTINTASNSITNPISPTSTRIRTTTTINNSQNNFIANNNSAVTTTSVTEESSELKQGFNSLHPKLSEVSMARCNELLGLIQRDMKISYEAVELLNSILSTPCLHQHYSENNQVNLSEATLHHSIVVMNSENVSDYAVYTRSCGCELDFHSLLKSAATLAFHQYQYFLLQRWHILAVLHANSIACNVVPTSPGLLGMIQRVNYHKANELLPYLSQSDEFQLTQSYHELAKIWNEFVCLCRDQLIIIDGSSELSDTLTFPSGLALATGLNQTKFVRTLLEFHSNNNDYNEQKNSLPSDLRTASLTVALNSYRSQANPFNSCCSYQLINRYTDFDSRANSSSQIDFNSFRTVAARGNESILLLLWNNLFESNSNNNSSSSPHRNTVINSHNNVSALGDVDLLITKFYLLTLAFDAAAEAGRVEILNFLLKLWTAERRKFTPLQQNLFSLDYLSALLAEHESIVLYYLTVDEEAYADLNFHPLLQLLQTQQHQAKVAAFNT